MKIALDLSSEGTTAGEVFLDRDSPLDICLVVSEEDVAGVPRYPRKPRWDIGKSERSLAATSLMADFCRTQTFQEIRYGALRMLDREDPSGSFRMVDKEVLFHAYCLSILDTQLLHQVEAYVADVTPHEFVSFLWWKLSDWRGLRVLFFQPCGIGPFVLPRRDVDVSVRVAPGDSQSDEIAKDARDFVARFFNRLETDESALWVQNQIVSDLDSRRPVRTYAKVRGVLSSGSRAIAGSDFDFSMVSDRWRRNLWLLRNLMVYNSKKSLRDSLMRAISHLPGPDSPFVLFPLHYEPERTSRPEGGRFVDQFNALLEVRRLVPESIALVVKEHYSQVSGALRGYLGRSRHFYPLVRSLPNTWIAPAEAEMIPLIRSAEAVFTLTGTIGIEAPYLGTRAVFFGEPWWAGIPGTLEFGDLSGWLDLESVHLPSRSEHIEKVGETIATKMIYGLAGESFAKSTLRWGNLPDHIFESYVYSVQGLLRSL